MSIEAIYELFRQHPHITTDTRKYLPDSIFFALKGEQFDGNTFVEQALENGCAFAVTDASGCPENPRIIKVNNVLQTLQELARHHRTQFNIPIIGITGTNGKTTTKELVASVLSSSYRILFTQGNLNNHIGVPLTLLQLTSAHDMAVIEMGANHPGEICELAAIALPTHGLITNVGKAHLEGFGSFENVKKTKGELYDFLAKTNETIFINSGNAILIEMANQRRGMKRISYKIQETRVEKNSGEDLVTGNAAPSPTPFLQLQWKTDDETYTILTHLIGKYNLENVLAAITVGITFLVPEDKICRSIENYVPQNNRSQFKRTEKNQLIIDTYNANPTSMLAALENFSEWDTSPKAVLLGDMKELGENSRTEHEKIIDFIGEKAFDKIILCGECFSAIPSPFACFPDTNLLIEHLKNNPLQGHAILIKGSRSMQLEKVIDFL